MRMWHVAVVVVMTACGEQRAEVSNALTVSCAPANGTWVSEATRTSMVGTCPRAKEHTRDKIEFDDGTFISPGGVFVPCSTEQLACTLRITCQVLDLTMKFEGQLVEAEDQIVGTVSFSGDGDCKSAVYDLIATRPQP